MLLNKRLWIDQRFFKNILNIEFNILKTKQEEKKNRKGESNLIKKD